MAVIKLTKMRCDLCDAISDLVEGGAPEAKAILRQLGWRFRGGTHRCPTCVGAQSASTPTEQTQGGEVF